MTAGGAAAAAELPLCPVCCETLGKWGGPATLPCGHNGCLECFQQVQQHKAHCPLCRAPFGKELKLSCNHELEDLIRLATMLFVDESAQQDGWEAFPTQQLMADSYAAELMRGNKKANAAAAAAAANETSSRSGSRRAGQRASGGGAAAAGAGGGGGGGFLGMSGLGFGLASLSLGFGGGGGGGAGNPNTLEDLQDIMTADPLASRRRRHSDGSDGDFGADPHGDDDDFTSPSAPALRDSIHSSYAGPGAGPGPSASRYPGPMMPSASRGSGSSAIVPGGGAASVLSLEPPLWLPDSHASECLSCHMPFRPFTRLRHHCRLCGKIFCSACCHKRALLPPKYGVRTPQRVCELCSSVLQPHQQLLAGTLAAAAQPPVQDCPDAVSLRAWLNSPWTASLGEDVFKAANMLSTFVKAVHLQSEAGLPTAALQGAAGLALLSVARLGAGWSVSFGTGLVVARTQDGWSAPCAISALGMGWGLQLGGELADVLLVLRSREALAGMCGGWLGGGVVVGGSAAVSLGHMGRKADAGLVVNANPFGGGGAAAACGWSLSRGAFVGLSLEGTLLCCRNQVNLDFYGYPVTPRQLLLEGTVPPPPAAAMLYEGIRGLLHRFECRRRLVHSRSAPPSRPHPQPHAQQHQLAAHPHTPAHGGGPAPILGPASSGSGIGGPGTGGFSLSRGGSPPRPFRPQPAVAVAPMAGPGLGLGRPPPHADYPFAADDDEASAPVLGASSGYSVAPGFGAAPHAAAGPLAPGACAVGGGGGAAAGGAGGGGGGGGLSASDILGAASMGVGAGVGALGSMLPSFGWADPHPRQPALFD
ncbi:hypothetical protein HYH03_003948 [Edaphochlamys debaryana]|uniref:FYVE-type domain-containing protein n=1 Tax=Edaphochlamys debaryana TaxID=47281 RepID=A0A835YAM0_9CHLO|nr:hypothetical protein HYH03_003948 [Edaphochlamys debaryana]|eukprot:KAG2498194.1 hypothetical protein HYH03_003948 [Edaphochlamys debaryana]